MDDYDECVRLADERGYHDVELRRGILVTHYKGMPIDYVAYVLAPRGLVSHNHRCHTWQEARRLLGMMPPARKREVEPTKDSMHPEGF